MYSWFYYLGLVEKKKIIRTSIMIKATTFATPVWQGAKSVTGHGAVVLTIIDKRLPVIRVCIEGSSLLTGWFYTGHCYN